MSDFEARYDQIENYLKGKLSFSEKTAFALEMERNIALKEEVAIQRAAFDMLQIDYLNDMSNIIKEQSQKPNGKFWKWFGLTSIGIITLLSSYWFISMNEDSTVLITSNKEQVLKVEPKNRDLSFVSVEKVDNTNPNVASLIVENKKNLESDSNQPLEKKIDVVVENKQTIESNKIVVATEIVQVKTIEQTKDNKTSRVVHSKPLCNTKPLVEVITVAANRGEVNGSIRVVNKSKERLLYKLSINDFGTENNFPYLEKGDYKVKVKTEDACEYDFGVFTITESMCFAEKDFSFNLAYEPYWRLELPEDDLIEITIFNKLGQELVNRKLKNETVFEWNGYYDNHQKAIMGVHVLYEKNQQGEICKYNVVVSE